MKRLLLHVCCACCSVYVVKLLKREYEVVMFFSNSNLFPPNEYEHRLEGVRWVSEEVGIALIVDKYDHNAWLAGVKGLESESEKGKRCDVCFKFNLEKTAVFAYSNGFDMFATTLTVSPHKDAVLINKIGSGLGVKYGVKYLESDFKKQDGFKHSCDLSREMGLYRQSYCGCEFSKNKDSN